jgi:hypothetical protein
VLPVRRHVAKNAAVSSRISNTIPFDFHERRANSGAPGRLAWRLLAEYFDRLLRPSNRTSIAGELQMISTRVFVSQIPESVADAYDGVQSVVARDDAASLEELQGAVEYLLDRVKAARGLDGSIAIPRLN